MKSFYRDWIFWLIMAMSVAAFFVASEIELFELIYQYTRDHEDWQLDEYFSLTFILPIVLPLLMYRANRQLRTVIADKEAAEAHATHLAMHDVLTGLGNRRQFTGHLDVLLDRDAPPHVSILLFDLDGFKAVNDKYGHRAGDGLLQVLAKRIAVLIGDSGLCTRLGGDEFAVVIAQDTADILRAKATALAASICETIGDPVQLPELDGIDVQVSASVGVAFLPPAANPSDLLRDADRAMYAAKMAGKNCWRTADALCEHPPPRPVRRA